MRHLILLSSFAASITANNDRLAEAFVGGSVHQFHISTHNYCQRQGKGQSHTASHAVVMGKRRRARKNSALFAVVDASNNASSKREMLKFAIPALGIYLSNPLLSNIDNAFVGRTVGAAGLAALSPATLCIDQALYLFSFLSRAATGLASRSYYNSSSSSLSSEGAAEEEARERMKDAASPAFSVSFIFGVIMSVFYASSAPRMLNVLNVDPLLHTSAISYIRWRGVISWATMAQSVLLSLFIVTKDAITPLKIIASAAVLNVIGDALFCAWPLKMGCGGAAAATALATLVSSGWMVSDLTRRRMMPRLKIPNWKECGALMEFTGPLLAITLTRMAGFMNMQRKAMTFGLESLAGYQLCMNLLVFFILFGEPLSQLAQTKLPSLIDSNKADEAMAIFKSIMILSTFAAMGVGAVGYLTALLGSGMFTSNVAVQAVAKSTAPVLFFAVSQTIVGIAVDGALMASRDFGFMLAIGLASFALQAKVLTYCNSVPAVFATFSLRLATYAFFSVGRISLGYGNLGRVIRGKEGTAKPVMAGT
ncbi:hypothetical protein ACHAW5_004338 [Stephanodiscus triporus]|uniref:Protein DETOXIFICATION n=1 Tax=Stephanodiscus triporus TaxID=2934178 RepID=A0ABD3PQC1_9STRA